MAEFVFKCNITDKHGNPLIGVEVEAINCNDFTPALADPIQHVVALATTDISGTATFTGLDPGMYYARPRLTRPDIRIQVMVPSGMGGGGKMCYAALVNPAAGIGTHTTIQSAITALGITGGLIFICAGTYQENLTVAGDTEDLWLVGAGRGEVLIQGTAASPTITVDATGTGPVTRFRLEHLTIDHTGSETLLYFNSVGGGTPTQVDLLDLRFVSGLVGIDFSDLNGGSRFTLRDIIMESTVVDAGQLEVSDLVISNLKTYCTGDGLYVAGATAANGIRISDSRLGGGGDFALRIGTSNDVQVTNTRIVAIGGKGIWVGNAVEVNLDDVIIDMTDGIGIDLGGIGTALSITGCKLSCASSQAVARVGITVSGLNNDIHIADTRINGFESFGIHLETLVAGGAQHFVLDGVTIINGADTHSISITGWDFGTITGCVLVGTGGGNTTYGVYGDANTTYVVIVGNVSEGHDGLTNLVNGVDGNVIGTNAGDGTGLGPSPHDAVTLDANADTLLALSTQELGLDTQTANLVFSGPAAGGAAVPTFRSLVDADIPAAIARDTEVTNAISAHAGDDDAHHALVTLGAGTDPALTLAGQELTLAAVLTPTEHTAIGDNAPHHAEETGESGTHTHGDLYYTEAEHGGVSPQGHHALVTLAADAQELLNLSTQALGFVAKAANLVLAGPAAGGAADPTFRSLVVADIPDISATYIALAFIAAKGDLIGASADNTPLILTVGDDDQVLIADSGEATGLRWGAAAGGGATDSIVDADADTEVHTEKNADEDFVRMKVAGTERLLLQDSTPHLTLTGDQEISGSLGLRGTAPLATRGLRLASTESGTFIGVEIGPTTTFSANSQTLQGISGEALAGVGGGDTFTDLRASGLKFLATAATVNATGTFSQLVGAEAGISLLQSGTGGLTVPQAIGLRVPAVTTVLGTPVVTDYRGVEIVDPANAHIATAAALYIEDVTLATTANLILELGPTPYLRLLGSGDWTPAAGETPLYLAYGGTPTLGQVKYAAAGGGGTKEEFLAPRPQTAISPAQVALGAWHAYYPITDGLNVFFLWRVPADFASLNSVNVLMIPDATETVQADLRVEMSAVGELYTDNVVQLLNQQLAVTINLLTEWDIKLGTLFDNIAAEDYVAIRFNSDTTSLRVLGCRISYEAGGNGGATFLYLD